MLRFGKRSFIELLDMGTCFDILDYLEPDVFLKILTSLEDPADLVRIGTLSQSWRHFSELELFICRILVDSFMRVLILSRYVMTTNVAWKYDQNVE